MEMIAVSVRHQNRAKGGEPHIALLGRCDQIGSQIQKQIVVDQQRAAKAQVSPAQRPRLATAIALTKDVGITFPGAGS